MRIVVYWARAEGAHTSAPVALNEACWPIMHRQVKKLGYELTLLTAKGEQNLPTCDEVCYFDVDPALCALAREQCWSQYLQHVVLRHEHVVMVEPDTYLRKRVPEMPPGYDLVLFSRNMRPTPTCFRICRGSAFPYYKELCDRMLAMPIDKQVWSGDMDAQDQMLGGDLCDPSDLPDQAYGCAVEIRDSRDYCFEGNHSSIAWCFNGKNGKLRMLRLTCE